MPIPESDLVVMANIGAQVTSKETYATVKTALESADAGYAGKSKEVFLQGSYGNDTNIWRESDVDVVIRLDAIFTYDINDLPPDQKAAFQAAHPSATYTRKHFRDHVLEILFKRFGEDVEPGAKAVQIKPRGNRRKADVLIATQHRKYRSYQGPGNEHQVTGISFHKLDDTRVVNYPKQHRENLISKNQETGENFKRVVRIFKNARQKLVEQGALELGVAPSYYIEGLLYNAPDDLYAGSYQDIFMGVVDYLWEADRSKFLCANQQYPLLDGSPDVTWNNKDCFMYLNGVIGLWKGW
jgi:hypothetical protein